MREGAIVLAACLTATACAQPGPSPMAKIETERQIKDFGNQMADNVERQCRDAHQRFSQDDSYWQDCFINWNRFAGYGLIEWTFHDLAFADTASPAYDRQRAADFELWLPTLSGQWCSGMKWADGSGNGRGVFRVSDAYSGALSRRDWCAGDDEL